MEDEDIRIIILSQTKTMAISQIHFKGDFLGHFDSLILFVLAPARHFGDHSSGQSQVHHEEKFVPIILSLVRNLKVDRNHFFSDNCLDFRMQIDMKTFTLRHLSSILLEILQV